MKSAWIVWTSIRRSCTLPGIPRTTSLRWQRPTTSTYSRINLTASSRAICGGNADNQHPCPALLGDQTLPLDVDRDDLLLPIISLSVAETSDLTLDFVAAPTQVLGCL
uniref:Uncharacterized protein n=1 Tax=Oreochromis niloticus TaxID=8128 RepID=A0A669DFR2_ORENI